jgi:hypothetical protein
VGDATDYTFKDLILHFRDIDDARARWKRGARFQRAQSAAVVDVGLPRDFGEGALDPFRS